MVAVNALAVPDAEAAIELAVPEPFCAVVVTADAEHLDGGLHHFTTLAVFTVPKHQSRLASQLRNGVTTSRTMVHFMGLDLLHPGGLLGAFDHDVEIHDGHAVAPGAAEDGAGLKLGALERRSDGGHGD